MLEALQAGITAAFCYNDMHAVGALLACRELGITVPIQVSIVGFDDVELAQYVTPPLTTMHQPKLRLGQLADGDAAQPDGGSAGRRPGGAAGAGGAVQHRPAPPVMFVQASRC